jgi:hypothetical protein
MFNKTVVIVVPQILKINSKKNKENEIFIYYPPVLLPTSRELSTTKVNQMEQTINRNQIERILKFDNYLMIFYNDSSMDVAEIKTNLEHVTLKKAQNTNGAVSEITPKTSYVKKKHKPLNGFKSWTPHEKERLLKWRREGLAYGAIGKALGRTSTACNQQHAVLIKEGKQ